MAQSGIYPKFRADSRDGDPLSGGRLYSYASGTSTPKALYADADLTQALPNPVILDASGEALFYYDGGTYALELRDKDEVPQWVIDPVTSGLAGATGIAGMGIGSNTVLIRPTAGTPLAAATVFPPDVLAVALTVCVTETLGSAQGLQQVGIGNTQKPDAWGVLRTLTATRDSTAGWFLAYGGQPMLVSGGVTLTAYGGVFDGSGAVYVTGHFFHFTPSDQAGYRYLPGTPAAGQILPPMPPATEEAPGAIEIATQPETNTGTDPLRAITPATLTGRLNTRVPAGTPLSVARYATGGTSLETAPLTVDASGNVRVGTVTPGTSAVRNLVMPVGVAPSGAHPASAVQIWPEDFGGAAGETALRIRSGTGVITSIGTGLYARKSVLVLTASGVGTPYVLTPELSGRVLVGSNPSGITYILLPANATGLFYTIINFYPPTNGTRAVANTGQTIRIVGNVSTSGGYAQSQVVGSFLHLVGTGATGWTAIGFSAVADWTVG